MKLIKLYDFNPEKNLKLKQERGISFEEIITAIEEGHLLDVMDHPNKNKYNNQKIYIVEIEKYIYLVPFIEEIIEEKQRLFLKTIFPSRKLTKTYLKRDLRGK